MQVIDKKKGTTKNIDIVSVANQTFPSGSVGSKKGVKGKNVTKSTGAVLTGISKKSTSYKGPSSSIGTGIPGTMPSGGH